MGKRQLTLATVLALAAFLGLSAVAHAGVVATIAGRREGTVTLQPGVVRVGADAIPWADVMLVVNDAVADRVAAPNALRFKNGEVLVGRITSISKKKVTIEAAIFGTQTIETDHLAAIDFVPGLGAVPGGKNAVLYREAGKPIPGKIRGLREDRLTIDSPIGAVALKTAGLKRYVFAAGATVPMSLATDEVTLCDGNVLRGTVLPAQNALVVEHPTLGKRSFGPKTWVSVRRYSGPAWYLSDLQPIAVESYPLINRLADMPRMEFNSGVATGPVSQILVSPRTRMEYTIPGKPGEKYLLTAVVHLLDGSRGSARFEIRIDGKPQLEKILNPGSEKQLAVSFDVPVGSELEIDVDFDDRVRFPCGVSIDNALLVKK